MLLGIQIIVFLFSLFMAYYSFLHFKRKEFTKREVTFWLFLWMTFIVITFIPNLLKTFSISMGFARLLDGYIVFGFLFLTSVVFYIYTLVRRLQRSIEEIVRKIALENSKKEN
ncbi:MAG: DUF2304 domain-containing protein [Deltaproteobacteria bacterium]|nr:DUF2304 domain-containing protein [Deltaproteobacteria bacterium]